MIQPLLLVLFLGFAFYFDSKTDTIPNKLTYSYIIVGTLYSLATLGPKVINHLLIALLILVFCLLLYACKALGGGDVKLILAITLLMGWAYTLWLLAISCIVGIFYTIFKLFKVKSQKIPVNTNKDRTPSTTNKNIRVPLGVTTFWASLVFEGILLLSVL